MIDEPRVTLADCHAMVPRYCNNGCRDICDRYDLDWDLLRGEGLPFSQLLPIDDAMIQAVILKARERIEGE